MPFSILRPSLIGTRNRLFSEHASQHDRRTALVLSFSLFLTAVVIFGVCTFVLYSMKGDPFFEAVVPTKLIQLLFYSSFFFLLLANTIAVIGNLYAAKNMDLLVSTPISPLQLYLAKLVETVVETGLMFYLFAVPSALAYSVRFDLGLRFLLTGLVVSLLFLLIPAGIAVIVGTLFVYFSEFTKKYRRLLVRLAVVAAAVWVAHAVTTLSIAPPAQEHKGAAAVAQWISVFGNPNPIWLPSHWAADLMAAFVGHQTADSKVEFVLLAMTAFGSIALGFAIFDLFFLKARSAAFSHYIADREDKGEKIQSLFSRLLESFLLKLPASVSQLTRAMISKDIRSAVRDRTTFIMVLLYAGVLAFYAATFNLISDILNLTEAAQSAWLAFLACINVVLAGFITTSLLTRLVYPSISLEGRAFWILLVAPIDIRRIIYSKFITWLPATLLVSLAIGLTGAVSLQVLPVTLFCTFIIGAALSIGFTGLAIGIGAVFATFEWKSPSQVSSGLGTTILFLLSIFLVIVISVPSSALLVIASVPQLQLRIGMSWSMLIMAASTVILIFANTLIARWACERGIKSLNNRSLTFYS